MNKPPLQLKIESGLFPSATIQAGDTLDLGEDGIIIWYGEDEAEAYRQGMKDRQARRNQDRTILGRMSRKR